MIRTLTILLTTLTLISLAAPAVADWDVGDGHKMHYPQLPDISYTGLDVLAAWPLGQIGEPFGKILADDWKCSGSGFVTDVHIWGSWLHDQLPMSPDGNMDPMNVAFKLSIHENIPEDVDPLMPWSHPGPEIWGKEFRPDDPNARYLARLYAQIPDGEEPEQFYDPNLGDEGIIGTDRQVWQYNFYIDPTVADAFWQDEGKIYWLNVQAWPDPLNLNPDPVNKPLFGWKTSRDHFMDDAVWGDNEQFGMEPPPVAGAPQWQELVYPFAWPFGFDAGAPAPGESIDLAFVITPEPGTVIMLLGAGLTLTLTCTWRRRRR